MARGVTRVHVTPMCCHRVVATLPSGHDPKLADVAPPGSGKHAIKGGPGRRPRPARSPSAAQGEGPCVVQGLPPGTGEGAPADAESGWRPHRTWAAGPTGRTVKAL